MEWNVAGMEEYISSFNAYSLKRSSHDVKFSYDGEGKRRDDCSKQLQEFLNFEKNLKSLFYFAVEHIE